MASIIIIICPALHTKHPVANLLLAINIPTSPNIVNYHNSSITAYKLN